MIVETLRHFNWVDVLIIILLARICYVGLQTGLPVEFFKFFGVFTATYVALQYYTVISAWLISSLALSKENPITKSCDLFAFLLLTVAWYYIFVAIRIIFCKFIKVEAVSGVNKWGGLILGVGRALLLVGMVLYGGVLVPHHYFKNSIKNSYSGKRLVLLSPCVHDILWYGIASKFMPGDHSNSAVSGVRKELSNR